MASNAHGEASENVELVKTRMPIPEVRFSIDPTDIARTVNFK